MCYYVLYSTCANEVFGVRFMNQSFTVCERSGQIRGLSLFWIGGIFIGLKIANVNRIHDKKVKEEE